MKPNRYRVIRDFASTEGEAVDLDVGDRVTVGQLFDEDPEWPGWRLCEDTAGRVAWVPECVLAIAGDVGKVLEPYTSHELSAAAGERLTVTRILNGWAWAENAGKETGWIPLRHIEPLAGDGEVSAAEELQIRPYEASDRRAVIDLWTVCGLVVPWNDPGLDIDRKCAVDPEGFLVGVVDRGIVATCMAGYEGHRGWINYLAVAPDQQKKGLGSQMMADAERRLRAAGCPKINLQVREGNRGVIRFYESIGYRMDPVVSLGKRLITDEDNSADDGEPTD